jgi:hypothetical protein
LWTFDRVFHGRASQADIFNLAAKETAEDVMKGYNGTIFAYGQVRSLEVKLVAVLSTAAALNCAFLC